MTAPIAPSLLTATADGPTIIRLTWQDNSSDEANFELERSPNGSTGWTLINSPAANATSYANTGLTANTEYFYRIRAVNGDGNSAYSNTASDLTLVAPGKQFRPRLYILQPDVVFAARVNLIVPFYPIDEIPYDTVTTGAYTDILPDMTVLLGTAAGLDDLGSQRIRKAATSTSIYVGRSSLGARPGELTVTNNAYITVLWEYKPWAKMPAIGADGTVYKDSDLAVGVNTDTPPPVAVAQASFAATIDSGTSVITVLFDGQSSFATDIGATITDYLWDIADGTLISGTLTDDTITVTFPAGYRYVDLTVTDSNAITHTTHRLIYARDPANDDSVAVEIKSHAITEAGQRVTVRPITDVLRTTYREGAPCLLWEREPSGTNDRDHMLIVGYLHDEPQTLQAQRTGNMRDATLQIWDIAGKLNVMPGLPQSITNDDMRDVVLEPAITWAHMYRPTLDKYIHYLLHWHSTALAIADFTWTGTEDLYTFVILTSDGASLWAQIDQRARQFLPNYCLTCDRRGRIAIVPDPMVRDTGDRTSTVLAAITAGEYSGLEVVSQKHPRIHWLRGSAILTGLTEPIETIFSIAPGETAGQGVGAVTLGEQLALSQDDLNSVTGHQYARHNSALGRVRLTLVQNDTGNSSAVPWREIDPAYKQWITLTLTAADAAQRGLTFATVRALPLALDIAYDSKREGNPRTVVLTAEIETVGEPGVTVVKPTIPAVGEGPVVVVPVAPDLGLVDGQEDLAALTPEGDIYRTADFQTVSGSGGPTWEKVALSITDTRLFSFVVDPFSPGYIAGTGAINCWAVGETNVWRITDVFGTPDAEIVHTFSTVISTSSLYQSRTINASFGAYFPTSTDNPWLIVVSQYADASGHTGTWATYSVDAGATWATEVQVTEHYDLDTTGTQPQTTPALCMSPKTPGLAYTVGYIETSSVSASGRYRTTDWGQTWTQLGTEVVDDPSEPLPMWAWLDSSNVTTLLGLGGARTLTSTSTDESGGGSASDSRNLFIAPAANTKRIEADVFWSGYGSRTNGGSSAGSSLSANKHTTVTQTGTPNYVQPTVPAIGEASTSGSFSITWEFAGGDWPVNRGNVESSPPAGSGDLGCRIPMTSNASASGVGNTATGQSSAYVVITEIELDDSTIYTPPLPSAGVVDPINRLAGDIHIPFEDNASELVTYYGAVTRGATLDYSLWRVEADGTTNTEISPVVSSRPYGVNAYGFRIRAYDSDRSYVAFGGTGNDATGDTGGDYQAVFVSDDGGDTWANIVTPVNSTEPFAVAFAGDTQNVLYLWGPAEYISYSSNFGAAIDDRSGDLGTYTPGGFLGIMGGPTA